MRAMPCTSMAADRRAKVCRRCAERVCTSQRQHCATFQRHEPRHDKTDDNEGVHSQVAPGRVPNGQPVPQRSFGALREPEAQHGIDKRRKEEVEERARFRLHVVATPQEGKNVAYFSRHSESPFIRVLARHLRARGAKGKTARRGKWLHPGMHYEGVAHTEGTRREQGCSLLSPPLRVG
jgi:hypothetical protein